MSSAQDIVLLLTHSGDYFTVDRVAQALSKRGASPFRLDTDLFPLEVQLSARLSNSGLRHQIRYGDRSISTEQVTAVWMRRLWEPKMNPKMEPRLQSGCVRESRVALYGFLDSLHHLRWVDTLPRIREAENKLLQLRIAAEVGLAIPRTLVTNDSAEARQFFQEIDGKMAAKLLTPLSYSMGKSSFFMYTSAVQEQDLAEAETLRYCPMVFQETIPKRLELRVIYVAGELFVGALEASRYAEKTLDWRNISPEDCPWESHQITGAIPRQLNSLMTRLGLTYGAIDLIQKPNGKYIFLEVNPTGEWGMLERDLDLPISDAIAKALLN